MSTVCRDKVRLAFAKLGCGNPGTQVTSGMQNDFPVCLTTTTLLPGHAHITATSLHVTTASLSHYYQDTTMLLPRCYPVPGFKVVWTEVHF